jgi:hypothetical protein
VLPATRKRFAFEASTGEPMAFVRFAVGRFDGGGLFVPFGRESDI